VIASSPQCPLPRWERIKVRGKMERVKVRVFSQAIPDRIDLELDEGTSVESLLLQMKARMSEENMEARDAKLAFLNNTGSLIVLLNGMSIYSLSGWKTILQDGDEVSLLPMVAGG